MLFTKPQKNKIDMSLSSYGIYYPCAFVIDEEIAKAMLNIFEVEYSADDDVIAVLGEAIDNSLVRPNIFTTVSMFEGELIPMFSEAEEIAAPSDILFVECSRDPSFFKAVYADKEELIEEFRTVLKPYLPYSFTDTDIKKHLYKVIGVMYS